MKRTSEDALRERIERADGTRHDERPCEVDTCDNLAAPGSTLCWTHLRRRRLQAVAKRSRAGDRLPMHAPLQKQTRDARERLLREARRLTDDLEAPAGCNPAEHQARAERRFFRAVRQYARERMRAKAPRPARR